MARMSLAPSSSAPLDSAWVRRQFPSLALRVAEHPVIYFDNPAGTQVPDRVIARVTKHFMQGNANAHGDFLTSRRTDAIVSQARSLSAAFLGARSPAEIAFGPNMTTLTYSLSRILARNWSPGDEVIVTDLDHDANISPWLDLADRGISVRRIPLSSSHEGTLDLQAFERLLSPRTRLVAVGYASNALGTINDLPRIVGLAHAAGAKVWVDAVHYGPHGPIDVQALGCDFLVCSAYKFFGPHLGILWGRRALLDQLRSDRVRPAPSESPAKFETGTKNHEGLAGLVGTFEYLAELGGAPNLAEEAAQPATSAGSPRLALERAMRRIRAYELELGALLLDGLRNVPGLRIIGWAEASELERRVPTFGFTLPGVSNQEVAQRLSEQGIFAWAGHHYALTLMDRLGLADRGGVVRVGAVHYNTREEVERLSIALRKMTT
jgi:cysteine desulfurase family protein (TIGR01976 family)